jgi:protein gp37
MERTGPVWTGEIRVRDDLLTWPLFRRQPRRIAVDLMSDLFHESLAAATIDLLHAVIAVAHWHIFLVLTKRSRRMREYYADAQTPRRIATEIVRLSSLILPVDGPRPGHAESPVTTGPRPGGRRRGRAHGVNTPRHWVVGLSRVKYGPPGSTPTELQPVGLEPWPLPNLWPGVSVEDQDRMDRVTDLLETPAAIRWVCFEPLLDRVMPEAVPAGEGYFDALVGQHYAIDGRGRAIPIDGPAWRPLDWVVAGGELGAGARPMSADWLRLLRDQCVAAGVPFFFRQWGEWAPAPPDAGFRPSIARLGRRAAGRLLDGRSWDEMPAAADSD